MASPTAKMPSSEMPTSMSTSAAVLCECRLRCEHEGTCKENRVRFWRDRTVRDKGLHLRTLPTTRTDREPSRWTSIVDASIFSLDVILPPVRRSFLQFIGSWKPSRILGTTLEQLRKNRIAFLPSKRRKNNDLIFSKFLLEGRRSFQLSYGRLTDSKRFRVLATIHLLPLVSNGMNPYFETVFAATLPSPTILARLRIRLLSRMSGGKAGIRIRMQNTGLWNPPVQERNVPPKIPYGEFSSVRLQGRHLGEAFSTDQTPRIIGLPSPIVPSPKALTPRSVPGNALRLCTSVRATSAALPQGLSGPGYAVSVHHHLLVTGPIRPTRRHTTISVAAHT